MAVWLKSLLAVSTILALSLGFAIWRTRKVKRQLAQHFAGRDEQTCLSTCLEAFATTDPQRVRDAYSWVQALVNYPSAPIDVEDNLWTDLGIDQGDADALFESSHEWRGLASRPEGLHPTDPPKTVRELVAQVLWYGYEGYAVVLREYKRANAA